MVTEPARLLQAAELYAATFAGQREAYSYWNGENWQTAYDWNNGAVAQRPLTAEVVLEAFRTGVPISGYVLGPDNYTHVVCLDIDRADGQTLGLLVARYVRDLGGEGYIERSSRGAHVWMILSERRPAIVVRRAMTALVKESLREHRICPGTGKTAAPHPKTQRPVCPACRGSQRGGTVEPHRDPRIEFRPASDRLPQADDGNPKLGHCIRLPTMPHHKTGKRYPLINFSEGDQLSGKLDEMMLDVGVCDVSIFDDLAERAPLPKLGYAPKDLRYPHGEPPVNENASDILRELWGVVNAQPGRAVRCPAHEDKRPSLSIARDDQRAWCHSPTCDLNNDGHGRGTRELRAMAPVQRGS